MREAFCASCMRTVYRGAGDDDSCPVCSSPLVVVEEEIQVEAFTGERTAVIPDDEDMRLAAVARYGILDTPPDGAFDRIVRLAARVFDVPIATVTIVDSDRIWFKAKHGIDAHEIEREPGLCASAVLEGGPWIVNDAAIDARALENALVRGDLGLRFYAGIPLETADGYRLGTLNIIDQKPREMTSKGIEILEHLAELVVDALELRLAALRLHRDVAAGRADET